MGVLGAKVKPALGRRSGYPPPPPTQLSSQRWSQLPSGQVPIQTMGRFYVISHRIELRSSPCLPGHPRSLQLLLSSPSPQPPAHPPPPLSPPPPLPLIIQNAAREEEPQPSLPPPPPSSYPARPSLSKLWQAGVSLHPSVCGCVQPMGPTPVGAVLADRQPVAGGRACKGSCCILGRKHVLGTPEQRARLVMLIGTPRRPG